MGLTGISYTKHFVGGVLVHATATVYRHNKQNREELSQALEGIAVTRQTFPQGQQMSVDFTTTPPTIKPGWETR